MATKIWLLRRTDLNNGNLGVAIVDDTQAASMVKKGTAQEYRAPLSRPDKTWPAGLFDKLRKKRGGGADPAANDQGGGDNGDDGDKTPEPAPAPAPGDVPPDDPEPLEQPEPDDAPAGKKAGRPRKAP